MKTKLYHCLLAVVCLFAACKKDQQSKAKTPAPITDSMSYTINGKNYVLTLPKGGDYGNAPANLVYDPATGHTSRVVDTTMFFVEYSFESNRTDPNDTLFIAGISFFRKYANKDMVTANPQNYPTDQSLMYLPGGHIFATDFYRNSSTNGVGINIVRVGRTYSVHYANQASIVTQDKQANSSFVVTSLTHISGNSYWLEAKFNATLFNENTEQPTALTNGYVRMKVRYRPY